MTEEHKRKISLAQIGRKISEETKNKIRNGHLGKKLSKWHKKNISKGMLNHQGWRKKSIDPRGYILIKDYSHPHHDSRGYVYEHRLVIEKEIGRNLHTWEIVHHINRIKCDNRIGNLMVFKGKSAHQKFEHGKSVNSQEVIYNGNKESIKE